MRKTREIFDHFKGKAVEKLTLQNENGVRISVLTYGGIWYEYGLPDLDGNFRNVLLNADSIQRYIDNKFYVAAAVGRVAGRIRAGQFTLDGKSYQLPLNEGNNTLHGGENGFSYRFWNGEIKEAENEAWLELSTVVKSEEDGFPGDMTVYVEYHLAENDQVTVKFRATSTEDTLFNPTTHTYFNLDEAGTILEHQMQLNSSEILQLDDELLPNGNFKKVIETGYDFEKARAFDSALRQIHAETGIDGLDDVYHTPGGTKLELSGKDLALSVQSDRNAVVIFTANGMNREAQFKMGPGRNHIAVAIEPQTLSDAINIPDFGDIVLPANQEKEYVIHYHLKWK